MWVVCNGENDDEEEEDDDDDDDGDEEEKEDDGWMEGRMDGWIIRSLPEGGTVTKILIHIYANQNMDRTIQALRA